MKAKLGVTALLLMPLLCLPPLATSAQEEDEALSGSRALSQRLNLSPIESIGFMLNNTERAAISAALEGVRSNEAIEELQEMEAVDEPEVTLEARPEAPNVHLGGLIHVEGGGWSAWLNGTPATPEDAEVDTDGLSLSVTAVGPDGVELSWTGARPGGNLRANLRPNQTFIGSRAVIEEGRRLEPPEDDAAAEGFMLPGLDGDVFGTLSVPFSDNAARPPPEPPIQQ